MRPQEPDVGEELATRAKALGVQVASAPTGRKAQHLNPAAPLSAIFAVLFPDVLSYSLIFIAKLCSFGTILSY
jgi:hypothetical protein